ncbi:MAG: cytochrome d ubiquinol oxidase subunit II [Prevotella sp.]|nr:cytochrome d ubiquinol oxidase subunit II [Prevotella sp.]
MSYLFLQQYWWFIISLLGGLLVFLLFVQGANSMIFQLGKNADERRLLINSTGRKWEFTFTTLVTFGGGFFASFPLFYSTSFGGAYWLWMIILFSFVIQAVSYEFQNKLGNLLGVRTFQVCLVINGIVGPLLLGGAVATFFDGSNFFIDKQNLTLSAGPAVSRWANSSYGLDALFDIWNVVLGLAVLFLARILGTLYLINNVDNETMRKRCRKEVLTNTIVFLVFFLAFVIRTMLKDGFAYDPNTGVIFMQQLKYFNNLVTLWPVALVFIVGVVLVLYGIGKTLMKTDYLKGIWPSGIGTVLTVLALFLLAGWNNTAYYPSTADLQSSLTIQNSSSSPFTLQVMAIVSLLVPFVLAYIWYAWWSMDKKKLDMDEVKHGDVY